MIDLLASEVNSHLWLSCLRSEPTASRFRCSLAVGDQLGSFYVKGILLWLIGIPIPVIILLWVFDIL